METANKDLGNSDGNDKMLLKVAFHQGLHYYLKY